MLSMMIIVILICIKLYYRAIEKVENGIKCHSNFYRKFYVKVFSSISWSSIITTSLQTYFGGSQYDQLQINQRQEADVNIVLNLSQVLPQN